MTRLGTYAAIVLGAAFGAVWGFFAPAPFTPPFSVLVGALIGGLVLGLAAYSMEMRELP